MNTGKILLGVFGGLAAGALLGVLLAPDKGSETIRKISEKGKDTADDLEAKFNVLLATLIEKFDNAKIAAGALNGNVKQKFEEIHKDLKS